MARAQLATAVLEIEPPPSAPSAIRQLEQRFRDSSGAPLLVTLDGGVISYGQFWAQARAIARDWRRGGLRRGDTVALILANSEAMLCCYLACAIGGFVASPLDPTSLPADIDAVVALLRPRLILREPPRLQKRLAPTPADEMAIEGDGDRDFIVILSSGTTGRPKGILHSLERYLGAALSFGRLWQLDAETRLYHVFPMYYNAGVFNLLFCPIMAGATIVCGPHFAPVAALDFWARPMAQGVNTLCLSPTMAAALCRASRDPMLAQAHGARMRSIMSTSGPIPTGLRETFLATFGRPLRNCYGITELGGSLSFQTEEQALAGDDAGRIIPELDIELRPGSDGERESELWLHSPYMMRGYVTEQGLISSVDPTGFFPSGDLATEDDGVLAIRGRSKDVIIRGGHNINPRLIEDRVSTAPGVKEVAVVGLPHAFWGEIVVACIIADRDAGPNLEPYLFAYCRSALDRHHQPDRILRVTEFPRTSVGKVRKRDLIATVQDQD